MKKLLCCAVSLVLVLSFFAGCNGATSKPVDTPANGQSNVLSGEWANLLLGNRLPQLTGYAIDIETNDKDWLELTVEGVDRTGFVNYIAACENIGYTVDAERDENDFNAFDSEGYELELYFDEDEKTLEIDLSAPEELMEFGWPSTGLGAMLPATASNRGSIWWNDNESFGADIGNMDKEAFSAYADKCKDAGYNIDYVKGEEYFEAYSAEGYFLTIYYQGGNVIEITLEAPEVSDQSSDTVKPVETVPETTVPVTTAPPATTGSQTGLRPEFKEAMDSYEEFMNEYVAFMKKYKENPSDLSLLADYAKFMGKYAEVTRDFEKWNSEDMNNDEMAYYLDVQTRVTKKLLEVSQ